MIIDNLKNAAFYHDIHERIGTALNYLQSTNFSNIDCGQYEIKGADIYVMIQGYETKPKENGIWEAHRRYVDIQYIIEGCESIGYANTSGLEAIEEYNTEKDVMFLEGPGDYLTLNEGYFIILFPEDGHMPSLSVKEGQNVKKAVVKVAL